MSIIAKALKKAQEDRFKKQTKDDTVFTYTSSIPEKRTSNIFKSIKIPRSVLAAALAVVCVIVSAGVVFKMLVKDDETTKISRVISLPGEGNSAAENSVKKQSVMEELVSKKRPKGTGVLENLPELNGIMYSASNPQAIINDAVVSSGEIVDGFTVLEVFQNKVLMMSPGGNQFELKLR